MSAQHTMQDTQSPAGASTPEILLTTEEAHRSLHRLPKDREYLLWNQQRESRLYGPIEGMEREGWFASLRAACVRLFSRA